MPKTIPKMRMKALKLIQMGDSTHHQDHAITPVSLRTMKAIVKAPTNPIPPLELDELELFVIRTPLTKKPTRKQRVRRFPMRLR